MTVMLPDRSRNDSFRGSDLTIMGDTGLDHTRGSVWSAAWARNPYIRAAGIYVVVRLLGIAILALMSLGDARGGLIEHLTSWDGQWYIRLAEHGYTTPGAADLAGMPYPDGPMAYFPLYPALVAFVGSAPGIGTVAAALAVSAVAGVVAALGLARLANRVSMNPRLAPILITLWAGAPAAVTLSMAYTEALFIALTVWALVGVLERNWYLASACTILSGLTRSMASVLIVVVVVAVLIEIARNRARWPALVCALVSPLGLLGYWSFVAARTDSLTGWWDIEKRGWGVRWDFGRQTFHEVGQSLFDFGYPAWKSLVLILLVAVTVLTVLTVRRVPWPLAAYAVGTVVTVLGTAVFTGSKLRLVLPGAVAFLLPIALSLAYAKRGTAVAILTGWVIGGGVLSSYVLTTYYSAI